MDARRARLIRLGYAGAFACLFALAFPFRAGDLLFDAGLACGWVALVPFARMLRGLGPRAAFAWATSSATLGFCGVLFWVYVVVAEHGGAHPLVAVLAVVLLALANALHIGAAAALAAALEPRAGKLAFLVLPASWLVLEHLRGVAVFGGWHLDIRSHELTSSEGNQVSLTVAEFDLLAALVKQAGAEPYSREDLHAVVFKREWTTKDRGSLDNLVSRLRKKVELDPDHPAIIKTIRGAGYLLTAEVQFE